MIFSFIHHSFNYSFIHSFFLFNIFTPLLFHQVYGVTFSQKRNDALVIPALLKNIKAGENFSAEAKRGIDCSVLFSFHFIFVIFCFYSFFFVSSLFKLQEIMPLLPLIPLQTL